MRGKISNLVFGWLLIGGGLLYGLSILGFIEFTFTFDGWWTLFIIIPCLISLISDGFKLFSTIGLCIGVLFLLNEQGVIPNDIGYKLAIPLIIIIIGFKLIFKRAYQVPIEFKKMDVTQNNSTGFNAIFGGSSPSFSGQVFNGCTCFAIFGGVELNLRDAIITENCVISTTSVFGGTEIVLPSNVKAIVSDTAIFGGVDNKYVSSQDEKAPTILINTTCIFGGLDIK